ncbi:MAG: hypothetical protein JWP97_5469 [Labilithrix sp.]|nr:hypothetical protein [Labilithrix sp.]
MISLRRSLFASAVLLSTLAPFAGGCGSAEDAATDETSDELNYRSTAGQEFALTTQVTFALPTDIAAQPEGAAKQAAIAKHAETLRATVTTAIVAELDRIWPEDYRVTGAGVSIEFRQKTATLADLRKASDGTYAMTVNTEFSGIKDLEKKLPLTTKDGKTFLPVKADVGATAEADLQVFISPIASSLNAYPKYLDLFADGLDISVHVGGDHNDPPQDIDHARSIYDDLVRSGFKSPVKRFEDLKIDSGPLSSTIRVKGATVPVRVNIFHVDMSTPETRGTLVQAFKNSVKRSDVVIYDGHAGRQLDYSGVVVAYKPARASVPASTFKDIESLAKQQVYLFNGCETYTGYADAMYENPNRKPENTDIITTGNFSAIQPKANQVLSFIHSFIDQKNGAWIPRSWDSVLGNMNAVGERSWVHVYGVHGLDDNPKLSPLADVSKIGATCATDADCGAADSKCIALTSTKRVCGAACADTAGCPTGTQCVLPRGRTSADDQQCSPR